MDTVRVNIAYRPLRICWAIKQGDFAAFRDEARALFAERVPRERFLVRDFADAELALEEISDELLSHLERFEPHGAGNPRPVFSCGEARAETPFRPIGDAGWRGRLLRAGGAIDAVGWRDAGRIGELSASGDFRIHYRLSVSRWSGRPEVEIVKAGDLDLAGPPPQPAPEPLAATP